MPKFIVWASVVQESELIIEAPDKDTAHDTAHAYLNNDNDDDGSIEAAVVRYTPELQTDPMATTVSKIVEAEEKTADGETYYVAKK